MPGSTPDLCGAGERVQVILDCIVSDKKLLKALGAPLLRSSLPYPPESDQCRDQFWSSSVLPRTIHCTGAANQLTNTRGERPPDALLQMLNQGPGASCE